MKKILKTVLLSVITGSALLATLPAEAFWGWGPFDWFDDDNYYGPWGGGPWEEPWGYGYPYYGGSPYYGGYPYPYYGSYPYYGGYPGYYYPYAYPTAPAASAPDTKTPAE